jgi:hypothetical protein
VVFGTEILFMLVLGLLLVGPKRLPTILGHAQFNNATRSFYIVFCFSKQAGQYRAWYAYALRKTKTTTPVMET